MKKREDFGGMQKLHTLDNFESAPIINNKKLKDLAVFMESKGYKVIAAEDPTYESEGLLEFSKTTHAVLSKDGSFYGGLELNTGEVVTTQPTKDYNKIVEDLRNLKIKHLNESDYTTAFKTTKPVEANSENKKKRSETTVNALKHIEEGLQILKSTVKIDWMDDIPGVIKDLEDLLGSEEEGTGLRNLVKLYKKEAGK